MSETLLDPPPPRPPSLAGVLRLAAIGFVLLLLTVPQWMIGDLIREREMRRNAVQEEIGRSWARPQTMFGPVLVVPWRAPISRDADGGMAWQRGAIAVLPAELNAEVVLAPETRRRGLFEATVYTATAALAGSFALPAIELPDVPEAQPLWEEAYLIAGSTELRPAGLAAPLVWDGRSIAAEEGDLPAGLCAPGASLRWPLAFGATPEAGRRIAFDLRLALRGSERFGLLPLAGRTRLALAGAWPTPSFTGAELPETSRVDEAGFAAEWTAGARRPLLRRDLGGCRGTHLVASQAMGVVLLEAVPTYRMVSRASKYTFFFLCLTFVTCAIFEMSAKVRLHAVQYALLGASVVLFPLLLLAIGEPLGFGAAYAISAVAVMAQASLYTAMATRRARLGLVLAGVLGALFGFLHVVLRLEAYALLAGTLALFLALSIVMVATRHLR
jgi:inner membrane protein